MYLKAIDHCNYLSTNIGQSIKSLVLFPTLTCSVVLWDWMLECKRRTSGTPFLD